MWSSSKSIVCRASIKEGPLWVGATEPPVIIITHTHPHTDVSSVIFIVVIPILIFFWAGRSTTRGVAALPLSLPLSVSHSLFSHIVPAFRRSFFVWCWPSRKPFAYVVSSKHRTPLYSAPFKALIKRRPRAVNGTADRGLLLLLPPPPL